MPIQYRWLDDRQTLHIHFSHPWDMAEYTRCWALWRIWVEASQGPVYFIYDIHQATHLPSGLIGHLQHNAQQTPDGVAMHLVIGMQGYLPWMLEILRAFAPKVVERFVLVANLEEAQTRIQQHRSTARR